ncbi:MAG: B12-binding domain-containing radical SAM protein [Nanoarchaeota archaeon]|nr:B12-binding domain-containing radical SAM protein [Nanoarchaeota archaeon]MBU4124413.1 B12-binding domain-containing radical SAM protein [Nanoarchaeota archaeon]
MNNDLVSLIVPPSRANAIGLPITMLNLGSYLKSVGINCEIIDVKIDYLQKHFSKEGVENTIIEKLEKNKPKIIGMSCFTTELDEITKLAERIKKTYNPTIIVGGIHATLLPEEIIFKDSPFDIAVIGEGEITIAELSKLILKNESTKDVDGIAYLENNTMKRTAERALIANLDDLPLLDWSMVDMDYYLRPNLGIIRYMPLSGVGIFTGRGCPFSCSYCANKNLWKRKVRFRSVEKVVDEIESLIKNYKIDSFFIYDDTFTLQKERVIDFCNELNRRKINLIWGCQTRVNTVDEEMIKAMSEANCIQIEFGVESGSQKTLDSVSKGITIQQIKDAFKLSKKYNMRTFNNFMFNLVDEDEDDVKKTLNLVKELNADENSVGILTPYPGCDLYSKIKKLKKEEYILYDNAVAELKPEFKFAKHNIDLKKLLEELRSEYISAKYRTSFLKNKPYIKTILRSKRKLQYLKEYIKIFNAWILRKVLKIKS